MKQLYIEKGGEYMDKCKKCDNDTKGYKCDECGTESDHHVAEHKCGGDHCMPKCVGCNEAQAKCGC